MCFCNSVSPLIQILTSRQNDALSVSAKCRASNVPFYWSISFGLEGCFFVDLGPNYEYIEEVKKIPTKISFPTLQTALSMKMSKLKSKKVEVSQTLLRFRIFEAFRFVPYLMCYSIFGISLYVFSTRTQNGRLPGATDLEQVKEILNKMLIENEIDFMPDSLADIFSLPDTWANFLPTCSILGGILAQEIIKLMTNVGSPINNFFVYSTRDFCGRSFLLGDN